MKTGFIILPLIFVLTACTTVEVRKAPSITCDKEIALSKFPFDGWLPATGFFETGSDILATVTCSNVSGKHSMQLEWLSPEGSLYATSEETVLASRDTNPSARIFHHIKLQDQGAVDMEGKWLVRARLDDVPVAMRSFSVKKKAVPSSATNSSALPVRETRTPPMAMPLAIRLPGR